MIKHKITKQSSANLDFLVELDKDYLSPIKVKVLNKLKATIKVAGFREGNIPDNIAEREIGETRLQTEVMEEAINQSYVETVEKLKLEIIAHPKIQIIKFVPYDQLEYSAGVSVMPAISIDYKKLHIKKQQTEVSKKDLSQTLESLRHQIAEKKLVTREAKMGDELKIDFEGIRQGKPIEGASAQNQLIIIGNDQFIPGFEKNLIGLKAKDEKEFTISFPKDYSRKDLANKKVTFEVKIHEIKQIILPKVDDEFAKKIGNFKNLADLKKDIELKLVDSQKDQTKRQYENQILEQIMSKTKIDLPDILVDQQLAKLKAEVDQNLKNSGLDMKKYLELNKKTEKQLEDELTQEARKRVTIALVLRHVVEKEKLTVSDKDLHSETQRLRDMYKGTENEKRLDEVSFITELKNHILSEKAIKLLTDYALGGNNA